jgi:hypothetical protein
MELASLHTLFDVGGTMYITYDATATGARLLDLHRCFNHQASHTTQPPSFCAAATTACGVAARAAMPNSEEGSVVCCVPSCPD